MAEKLLPPGPMSRVIIHGGPYDGMYASPAELEAKRREVENDPLPAPQIVQDPPACYVGGGGSMTFNRDELNILELALAHIHQQVSVGPEAMPVLLVTLAKIRQSIKQIDAIAADAAKAESSQPAGNGGTE